MGFLSLTSIVKKVSLLLTISQWSGPEMDKDGNIYQLLERLIIWHVLVKKPQDRGELGKM